MLCSHTQAYAGITINAIFDSSITSDPNAAAIEGTINQAINVYQTTLTNPITVTINFAEMSSGLGQSSTSFATGPYSLYFNALVATQTSANDATAILSLGPLPPSGNNPVTGTTLINVTTANLRAVGINVNPPPGQPDGFIGLNTHLTTPGSPGSSLQFSLLAVTEHEIDEVLGLGSAINRFNDPFPEDLWRYNKDGTRNFSNSSSSVAFFSIDGTTDLARFNNGNNGGDWGDWNTGSAPPQVQDAFATPGSHPTLGVNELTALDVIGYNLASAVPEPSTVTMLGTALVLASGYGWSRRKQRAGKTVA
jgi:hypothetical protein